MPAARGPSAWKGSGVRLPSTQSAMYSPRAGPCLKPCPDPPPTSHHACVRGVWRDDEVRVRGEAVLADARTDHRCVGQRREPLGGVGMSLAAPLVGGDALERIGIDLLAWTVRRDLHAETSDVPVTVERRVVLAEARRAPPARSAAEKEDLTSRDHQLDLAGEEPGQPRPARPHHGVRIELLTG